MRDLDAEDSRDGAWETQGTEGGPPPDVRYGNAASENDLTAWARANEGNEWASILTQILAED